MLHSTTGADRVQPSGLPSMALRQEGQQHVKSPKPAKSEGVVAAANDPARQVQADGTLSQQHIQLLQAPTGRSNAAGHPLYHKLSDHEARGLTLMGYCTFCRFEADESHKNGCPKKSRREGAGRGWQMLQRHHRVVLT